MSRRIWKHLEAVELRFGLIYIGIEGRSILPGQLPLRFDGIRLILYHRAPLLGFGMNHRPSVLESGGQVMLYRPIMHLGRRFRVGRVLHV